MPDWVSFDIWRVVRAGLGDLNDVAEVWTIRGLIEAHALLDLDEELAAKNREPAP